MKNLFDLSGKTAIVTGGSTGISLAIAEVLKDFGAAVHCYGISSGFDLAREETAEAIVAEHEAIDIVVNSAGVTGQTWDYIHAVNLKAPYLIANAARPKMVTGSSIINVTSINAELAFPGNPAYVSSKHGLSGLTKAMALDYGKDGIRVNAIGPGYVHTKMTENSWRNRREEICNRTILGRWGTPDDFKGAVVFLASEASGYITGQTIYIDGGWLARGL